MISPHDALALHTAGRTTDALVQLFEAVGSAPSGSDTVSEHRLLLASLLEGVSLDSGNSVVFRGLLELFGDTRIDPQSIANATLGLLTTHGAFAALEAFASGSPPTLPPGISADAWRAAAIDAFFGEALVHHTLTRVVITNARVEAVLTYVRHVLFEQALQATAPLNDSALNAMSLLCGAAENGEYAWPVSASEQDVVTAAHDELDAALENVLAPETNARLPQRLLACAMYGHVRALTSGNRRETLPLAAYSESGQRALAPVLQRLFDRHEQRSLAQAIPSLTHASDALNTSHAVREMYESHPYPRWHTVGMQTRTHLGAFVRALTGKAPPPNDAVLIAGCGTGRQAAHTALSFPDSRIVAIDLSRSSLGYAAFKLREHGIHNVQLLHGDLLQLDALAEQFAFVTCSGVLHHLHDPMAGWRTLLRRLHPAGVMKVGLYSTLARRPLEQAKALIDSALGPNGITDDARVNARLREARNVLLSLPLDHPARSVTHATDFYSLSGCRDLLLHVQERSYTLEEIDQALRALDLRFLGFQLSAAVQAAFARSHTAGDAARDLGAWSSFEARHPQTFWGMYQFFVAPR